MVQTTVDRLDSHGESVNHKLDYMIGNREHGQLVQIDRANQPIPIGGTGPGGAAYIADFAMLAALQGKLFGSHWGTVTTPLATPATTAIVARRPQAWLRVPDKRLVVPLNFEIVVESTGITTQGEIAVATSQNDVGDGTSAAGTSGAINLNAADLQQSLVVQRQLATADVALETKLLELKRMSFAVSAVNQMFDWNARTLGLYPVLRGPASFLVYIGGNAVNFYAQAQWIEYPESDLA